MNTRTQGQRGKSTGEKKKQARHLTSTVPHIPKRHLFDGGRHLLCAAGGSGSDGVVATSGGGGEEDLPQPLAHHCIQGVGFTPLGCDRHCDVCGVAPEGAKHSCLCWLLLQNHAIPQSGVKGNIVAVAATVALHHHS